MLSETIDFFKYNTSNFKTPNSGFKHKLDLMDENDPDYKILKSLLKKKSNTDNFEGTVPKGNLNFNRKSFALKIYRVKTNDNFIGELRTVNYSSVLLLHGILGQNVEGILKERFRPSKSGSFSPGVY